MPQHVHLAPVPDSSHSTSESSAFISRNIPSQVVSRSTLCTLFPLSVFPVKNSYAAQSTLLVLRHGRPNTCVGCLPKVTGVRLPPVLAARQKSSSETHRKENFWQSRDPERSRSWPRYIWDPLSRQRLEIQILLQRSTYRIWLLEIKWLRCRWRNETLKGQGCDI